MIYCIKVPKPIKNGHQIFQKCFIIFGPLCIVTVGIPPRTHCLKSSLRIAAKKSIYKTSSSTDSSARACENAEAEICADSQFYLYILLYFQEPFTNTETPWHSDESYWLDLPDKRALSFWFPMQDVNVCNNNIMQCILVIFGT